MQLGNSAALGRLAEDGSRHLAMLSQGRYALRLGSGEAAEGARAEQDFFVVDHWNADGVRSVKTLSGGETFLASLALALAFYVVVFVLLRKDGDTAWRHSSAKAA